MVSQEFKNIIEEDIAKCEYEIQHGNKNSMGELHARLVSKYGQIIDGFSKDLKQLFYDDTGEYRRANLETMRQKLLLFKAMEYQNKYMEKEAGITVTNSNHVDVKVSISFEEARKSITDMSVLPDEEIEEILLKINEIESIVKSDERKTKKWSHAKEIIKWIADKGVDVGLTLLPLLMKMEK